MKKSLLIGGLSLFGLMFKEFSYINVEPTHTTIIITFIITLILTVVLCVYGINNRFEDKR